MGLRADPRFGQLLTRIWEDLQREVARMGWESVA